MEAKAFTLALLCQSTVAEYTRTCAELRNSLGRIPTVPRAACEEHGVTDEHEVCKRQQWGERRADGEIERRGL